MPDLIAQGPNPDQRWRRHLPLNLGVELGRLTDRWSVPWDSQISRRHVRLTVKHSQLTVERLENTTNPVFFRGDTTDRFRMNSGDHFVIGDTTFTFVDEQLAATLDAPAPVNEETLAPAFLEQLRFRDADRRIDGLMKLPEIISAAADDQELSEQLVSIVMAGCSSSRFVAVVQRTAGTTTPTRVLYWDWRGSDAASFSPSERLIQRSLDTGECVVHSWDSAADAESRFTQMSGSDWAFCCPVSAEACSGWAIYVAGKKSGSTSETALLHDDVKFTQLVANTLGRVRDFQRLERREASLLQFLSPIVMEALAEEEPEVALAPREAQVAVLFCDLRGFTRRSEREANDLMGLLHRVSDALAVMTRHIQAQGGVVGDFHGDAAMGFWGWPLDQEDASLRACRAALAVREEFARAARDSDHPLHDFRIGVGIASGLAVAGKIGTLDQVKVTAFGPVVNLAARLEGMTKLLRASILLDMETAVAVRNALDRGEARLRRVARVRPYGMEQPVEVTELLPPESDFPEMPDAGIEAYEQALDALQAADWAEAFSLLHRVPAEDRVKDFLTIFIAQNNRTPPPEWDGVIPLDSKS